MTVTSHTGSGDVTRQNILLGYEEISRARWWKIATHRAVKLEVHCFLVIFLVLGSPFSFSDSILNPGHKDQRNSKYYQIMGPINLEAIGWFSSGRH